ncbi:iron chelate uptake ABC transporter family permease subunit [Methylopila sp. M107]|uniref:ABC transporter permease n=1 Tax=Methylopila sp. M107 TaxID=1101190 RepID=UPI000364D66F|nr:iron chelate uptake ABC transporter family permease subunit [Methylopila sp. M107]
MTAARAARNTCGAALVVAGFFALVAVSLLVGVGDLSAGRGAGEPAPWSLIFASRLPRTLAAVLSGAGLAIAGLVMQTLARNRFVEPTTAGSAQSAGLGVLAVTLLWPSASLPMKTLAASAAALAGTSLFVAVAHRLPPEQPYLVPLFGLVYGGVLGSALTFAAWQADLLQYLEVWTVGEFSGVLRGRYELLWAAALMVALAWWAADRLTVLSLGRDVSVGLGLDYAAMMRLGLVIVSAIAALTVVVVGMIPFVGLVAPNIVTRLKGDDVRAALPYVALTGAALTLACDVIGRLVRYPYEIPVGVVLGVAGSGLFLWLLFGRLSRG